MNDDIDVRNSVYEIGYLIVSSIPEEKVPEEAENVKKIITSAGASIVSEEMPHRQHLAYTIRRKTVAGSYESYDEAYFGWVKFEVGTGTVESIKKTVSILPSVLRMLLITTVKENTYQGKHAPAVTGSTVSSEEVARPITPAEPADKPVAPLSVADVDKSIDDMVREA